MTKALFFNSNWEAELKKIKVKDGSVELNGKKFYVDETKPILLKTPFGVEQLYLIKWDCIYPAKIETKVDTHVKKTKVRNLPLEDLLNIKKVVEGDEEVKVVEKVVTTQVVFERDKTQTPESLYKSTKLKILGGMLKIRRSVGGFLTLIIGLLVGAGLILLFIKTGFLRI